MSKGAFKIISAMLPLQDGLCWWHGRRIDQEIGEQGVATIEHLQPRSLGGANAVRNYVIACRSCNNRRGNDLSWDVHPNLLRTRRYELLGEHVPLLMAMGGEFVKGLPTYKSHVITWRTWAYTRSHVCPQALRALIQIHASREDRKSGGTASI